MYSKKCVSMTKVISVFPWKGFPQVYLCQRGETFTWRLAASVDILIQATLHPHWGEVDPRRALYFGLLRNLSSFLKISLHPSPPTIPRIFSVLQPHSKWPGARRSPFQGVICFPESQGNARASYWTDTSQPQTIWRWLWSQRPEITAVSCTYLPQTVSWNSSSTVVIYGGCSIFISFFFSTAWKRGRWGWRGKKAILSMNTDCKFCCSCSPGGGEDSNVPSYSSPCCNRGYSLQPHHPLFATTIAHGAAFHSSSVKHKRFKWHRVCPYVSEWD